MGFAGGLSPSPSAVVVLLLLGAVALGRAWYGVLLMLAYGIGLAATLIGIGFALTHRLPAVTASVIVLVGVGMTAWPRPACSPEDGLYPTMEAGFRLRPDPRAPGIRETLRMLLEAPPLSPYHRLARTVVHRWWRPLAGTALVVAGSVAVIMVCVLLGTAVAAVAGRPENADGLPSFGPLADLALAFLMIGAVLPVTLVAARWVQRRPAGTLSSVAGRLRWRWLLTCLPVALAAVVLLLGVGLGLAAATGEDVGMGGGLAGWGPFVVSTLVLLAVVPLQAAAEEYLTRGWLLQAVGSWCRRPWLPIAVQALVFAALHGWGTAWGFADLVLFGVVTGWLTIRTGGLEAAIALHVLTNLVAGVLSAAYGDLTVDETAADMPWQLAVVDVPVLLAYAAVIVVLARRHRIADRSGPGSDGVVAQPAPQLQQRTADQAGHVHL